jgi:hypothetical protein
MTFAGASYPHEATGASAALTAKTWIGAAADTRIALYAILARVAAPRFRELA